MMMNNWLIGKKTGQVFDLGPTDHGSWLLKHFRDPEVLAEAGKFRQGESVNDVGMRAFVAVGLHRNEVYARSEDLTPTDLQKVRDLVRDVPELWDKRFIAEDNVHGYLVIGTLADFVEGRKPVDWAPGSGRIATTANGSWVRTGRKLYTHDEVFAAQEAGGTEPVIGKVVEDAVLHR